MKRFLMCSVLTLLTATSAAAQDLPRWDLSGEVGWLSSNKSDIAPDWDDWYDEATGALALGRYCSPHLRGELRVAFSGEGRIVEEQRVVVPGQPFPQFRLREHYYRTAALGAGVHYQFFDNQWFHPHVGAGVAVDRESERQLMLPDPAETTTVRWTARPFVAAGFKWYVNERGFVRSDLRLAAG